MGGHLAFQEPVSKGGLVIWAYRNTFKVPEWSIEETSLSKLTIWSHFYGPFSTNFRLVARTLLLGGGHRK